MVAKEVYFDVKTTNIYIIWLLLWFPIAWKMQYLQTTDTSKKAKKCEKLELNFQECKNAKNFNRSVIKDLE